MQHPMGLRSIIAEIVLQTRQAIWCLFCSFGKTTTILLCTHATAKLRRY